MMKLINIVTEMMKEGLNLQKKHPSEITFDGLDVQYRSDQYGKGIEITGSLSKYNTGRSIEVTFTPDKMDDNVEEIWDEHWEEISDEIERAYWKVNKQ